MTPLRTKSRQPLSHEWRRHSLVRVRRPAWSAHVTEAEVDRDEESTVEDAAPKLHTTHNDIAW